MCNTLLLQKLFFALQKGPETYNAGINYVGLYDMGDEDFVLGKSNTVTVPETGEFQRSTILGSGKCPSMVLFQPPPPIFWS